MSIGIFLPSSPGLGPEFVYLIGFQAISENLDFSKRRSLLTITADGEVFALGRARGGYGGATYGVHEFLYYKISRSALTKIAKAQKVQIRIDSLSGPISAETRDLIRQLVAAT